MVGFEELLIMFEYVKNGLETKEEKKKGRGYIVD
jgi:hypothetical protein